MCFVATQLFRCILEKYFKTDLEELFIYVYFFLPLFFSSIRQIAADLFEELYPKSGGNVIHCDSEIPWDTLKAEAGSNRYQEFIHYTDRLHIEDLPSRVEPEKTYSSDGKEDLNSLIRRIDCNMDKCNEIFKGLYNVADVLKLCVHADGCSAVSRYWGVNKDKISSEEHGFHMHRLESRYFYKRVLFLAKYKEELYPNSRRVLGLEALKDKHVDIEKNYSYKALNKVYKNSYHSVWG